MARIALDRSDELAFHVYSEGEFNIYICIWVGRSRMAVSLAGLERCMADEISSFELQTPERALQKVTGRLRDAVLAVQRALSMSTAVVSAYSVESPSLPVVQGYMDGAGRIKIQRNLDSDSGTEFENWSDARRHGDGKLPGGAGRSIGLFAKQLPVD
jgi:hypothetical protein